MKPLKNGVPGNPAGMFWAKALADLAAAARPVGSLRDGFLVAQPVMDARVFVETSAGWLGMM